MQRGRLRIRLAFRSCDGGCGWEACCLAGSRGSPHAARTSISEGKGTRSSGGAGYSTTEGALTVGSDEFAAPVCGRGWCSGGVCELGARSGRVMVDVVGRLVVSPGLEARRTRLAPRPSGEGHSVIEEGALTVGGGAIGGGGSHRVRISIIGRGTARPTGGQSGRAARRFFSAATSKSAAGQSRSRPDRASMSSSQIARRENHFRLAGMRYHGVASESQRSKMAW